ncbi:hypothetical protein M409DRAFT_19283 [Zasmidium cellare ATCC 36951]|uniref:Carboxylic ester hydrolase n=1 Tax=Zasmidium cellare ATCC 36951 TaxID=1080233 RepID=A0A6A6CX85_ZASCE|nr:uncharacterized protein M409DRAFT_19283 [Zasmidium cellare ATCC 36951]KAF2170462.1 hypothetical protein M409DRAFT_19283 [Zasmidium cellare ATCC 36951]
MRLGLLLTLPVANAFECSRAAFQGILPTNISASVAYATTVPENSTFQVPESNIAFPTSPVLLRRVCAVQINITSSASSAYSLGLFLPDEDEWNERLLAVGGGGYAGGIDFVSMVCPSFNNGNGYKLRTKAAGVCYGFAVAATDTGHNSTLEDGSWALDKEKLTDWSYRAMHGSVVLAKLILSAYYESSSLSFSYFSGCATGGRQGLKEIEMYPDDFDGVLVGDPAWWSSHLQPWTVKVGLNNLPTTAPHHIPPELFPVIGVEVVRQCDPQDGLVDGIVSDPAGCQFIPEALMCGSNVSFTSHSNASCLTGPQIETLYKIYGPYYETNQTFIFPGLLPGSENQWTNILGQATPNTIGTDYIRYFLFDDPSWNVYTYNFSVVHAADEAQPGNSSITNFDFAPFYRRGGKLIHYHGLADGLIPPESSDYFFRQLLKTLVPKGITVDSFYRLFHVPGMEHCTGTSSNAPWYFGGAIQANTLGVRPGTVSGTPGFPDAEHDVLLALMRWTEEGRAPERVVATKWRSDTLLDEVWRQRPICPYPKRARYCGYGDPDDADSWECL